MTASPRTKRRRKLRLSMLLALASTASAVSLNDLQPVQDGLLSVGCSMVYDSFITGCTTADFAQGQTCSLACIAGIIQIAANIANQCQDIKNSALTLLSDAQRGSLVVNLCVGNHFTLPSTTSTSSSIRRTSTTPLLTTPLLTTSRTIGSFSTIPFPTPTTTSTFTKTTSIQTTPLQSTATETTVTFVPPSTLSTIIPTTSQVSPITSATQSSTSTSTSTRTTSTSTSTSQSGNGLGGGSPFDTTSRSSRLSVNWSWCFAAGAILASLRLL